MTKIARFTPNDELRRMQRDFDRLFSAFFTPARTEGSTDVETAVWMPRVDLEETADAYLIHMDLPGLSKKDLNISFHEGVLTVSGDRKMETREEKSNFVHVERQFGRFYRSFTLPKAVDESKIEASYKDGVLLIRVPKVEAVRPRQIEVK